MSDLFDIIRNVIEVLYVGLWKGLESHCHQVLFLFNSYDRSVADEPTILYARDFVHTDGNVQVFSGGLRS